MKKSGSLFSRLVAALWNLLPRSMDPWLGKALAFLWLDVLGVRKDVIDANLEKAFPGISPEEKKRIGRASVVSMCRSFVDVIRIPYLTDEWIDQNVIFDGADVMEQMRSEPAGFFILTLHLGSGDLAAAIVSRKVRPVSLITKHFRNRFMDAFWFGLRGRSDTNFIDAHAKNNAFEILAALKKKRGVAFVLDQFMGMPYGVETDFFGVKTGTAYGLALFARKTGKPVYPIYTYWDRNGQLHIGFEPTVDLGDEVGETNQVMTNRFNRVLEKIIARHPEHWMWVHKRWKTFE